MLERRLYFTSTGCCWRPCSRCAARRGDDLQRHLDPRYGTSGPSSVTQLYAIALGLWRWSCAWRLTTACSRTRRILIVHRAAGGCSSTCSFSASCHAAARAAGSRSARFNLQPSEFARIVLALVLAMLFGERPPRRADADRSADRGALLARAIRALIARSPTSARPSRWCRCSSASPMSPACGCASLGILVIAAIAGWRPWRGSSRSRTIRSLASSRSSIRPKDPRGAGYQQIQARITVGSGGLGQRLHEGHAGAVQVPAGRPQ